MTVAMAMFALEDALIKTLSSGFSPAQIVWMLGLGGALGFAGWLVATGQALLSRNYLSPPVLLRTAFEAVGSMFFVSALAVVPLALASAVIQATPLVVALGAALFLGAQVGWRRWLAIAVGFGGVLIILRPTGEGFEAATLLAVFGMLGLAGRDLATRNIPADISGVRLSFLAFLSLVPAGMALQAAQGVPLAPVSPWDLTIIATCVAIGTVAYLSIVRATRMGDLAVVSSFRYTRMLFALIVGMAFFGERPDLWTMVGVSIVIASGAFTLLREARMRGQRVPNGKPSR